MPGHSRSCSWITQRYMAPLSACTPESSSTGVVAGQASSQVSVSWARPARQMHRRHGNKRVPGRQATSGRGFCPPHLERSRDDLQDCIQEHRILRCAHIRGICADVLAAGESQQACAACSTGLCPAPPRPSRAVHTALGGHTRQPVLLACHTCMPQCSIIPGLRWNTFLGFQCSRCFTICPRYSIPQLWQQKSSGERTFASSAQAVCPCTPWHLSYGNRRAANTNVLVAGCATTHAFGSHHQFGKTLTHMATWGLGP